MFATSLALIAQAFSGKERGTAIGIYGAVVGGAVAIGPLIGGAITAGIGWRWIFFLNIPIGVVAVVITLTKVENAKIPTGRRIDWLGFITFSASLFMLVFALVQGNAKGWGSTYILSLLIGSAVLMAIFLIGEWLQKDPMLDLTLFKRPAMVGVSLGSFALSSSIFAMFLYLTLYMQEILGYGAFQAGLRFMPLTLLAFIVAPIAGKLTVGIQTRYLMGLGLALVAIGCQLMTHVGATSSWLVLLPGFLVCGASASASPTRCWPRGRSRWSPPSAAACRPARPVPSARSGSPPASPAWVPSSSIRSSPPWWPTCRRRQPVRPS